MRRALFALMLLAGLGGLSCRSPVDGEQPFRASVHRDSLRLYLVESGDGYREDGSGMTDAHFPRTGVGR